MSAKKTVGKKVAKKSVKKVARKLVLPREKFEAKQEHIDFVNDLDAYQPTQEERLVNHCNKLHAELEEVTNPFTQVKRKQNELTLVESSISNLEDEIERLKRTKGSAEIHREKILTQLTGLRALVFAEIN